MCAPTKDLAKIAIIAGAAYATGGLSLGASGTATASTAATQQPQQVLHHRLLI
jgi:hypothetical protein